MPSWLLCVAAATLRRPAGRYGTSSRAPRVILTGGTWFGDVKILHQRMWERVLNRR
jgi:hypothetical protein